MATIVNNPGSESSSAGWIVAVIVLIAVLGIGYMVWASTGAAPTPAPSDSVNIDVSVPDMQAPQMPAPEGQ